MSIGSDLLKKDAFIKPSVYQISGSFGVAKDALAEISSRLRKRCLLDSNSQGELVPVTSIPEFGRAGNSHGGSFYPSPAIIRGSSGRYEPLKVSSVCQSFMIMNRVSLQCAPRLSSWGCMSPVSFSGHCVSF